jgi:hypothetical protein
MDVILPVPLIVKAPNGRPGKNAGRLAGKSLSSRKLLKLVRATEARAELDTVVEIICVSDKVTN